MDMPEDDTPAFAAAETEEDEAEEEEEEEFDEEAYRAAQEAALEAEILAETLEVIETLTILPEKNNLVWTPHHFSLATSFLREAKERLLCCYVVKIGAKTRLAVTLSLPAVGVGLVWYFLKLDSETKITEKNFKRCVSYGSLETNEPLAVQHFLLEIYQPILLADPSKPLAKGYYNTLTELPRLLNILGVQLVHHVGAAKGYPLLFIPGDVLALPDSLDQMKGLPLNVPFLSRTEDLVLHWVEQIHAFTFEQGDASSPLELGLLHEIRQLSKKKSAVEELLLTVESPGVLKVTKFLESQSSPFVTLLHQAIASLKAVQDRLHETGGQLAHLERLLDLLYNDSVQALTEHMFDVLALLRIIWTHSEHYHKQEVMAEICIRVSWEVTRACQVHLPLDSLLSPSVTSSAATPTSRTPPSSRSESDTEESKAASEGKDSLGLVEVAIKCCNDWRNCYMELAAHFREQDWPEVWLPEGAAVFLPVELFASRCEDLKYIGLSKSQLTRRGEGGVMSVKASGAGEGGAEGELLEEELAQVDRVLEDALKAIARRSHLVFNLTSKEWLRHFDRFRESMEEVERRYQCVMVAAVQTVVTVAQGLRVLNVFKPLAARKSLFNVFYVMIDHILNLFDRDFEEVEKEYVFRSMKVGNTGFYFSKMAKWANDTRRKLEHEVNLLKNQSWLPYYPRLDSIYLRWGRTAILLRGVVANMYAAWIAHLEPQPSRRLQEPIFRWKPGPVQNLQDNFDKQLFKNLEEARSWKNMGFDVPEGMGQMFDDSERLMKLKKQISECTDDFNSLMARLSRDETQMFEGQIQMVIKNFYPGLSYVNWTQQEQCAHNLSKCRTVLKKVQEQVTHYLDINKSIANDLDRTKEMVLYSKDDEIIYEGDSFQDDLFDQREKILGNVLTGFLNMEDKLDSLYQDIFRQTSSRAQEAWVAYIQRLDLMFLESQREILRKSLLTFEGMLMGSRSCPMEQLPPVFQLSASLKNKNIVCNPSVFGVLNIVTSLNIEFTTSLGSVPCLLRRYSSEKTKDHNHIRLLEDELCDKLQRKLKEEFQAQVDMLKIKLEEWQVYRDVWEIDRERFFDYYLKQANSVKVFETDIMSFQDKLNEIEGKDEYIQACTFNVNCKKLKKQIIKLCLSWIKEFEDNLFKIACDRLISLYQCSEKTKSLLKSDPDDIPSLLASVQECDDARTKLEMYKKEFQPVREQFTVLKRYKYSVPSDTDSRLADLEIEWGNVEAALTNKILDLNAILDGYRKKYSDRAEVVIEEVDELKLCFQKNLPTRMDKSFAEAKENIGKLHKMIENVVAKLDINEYLEMLSLPLIDFQELPAFKHDLIAIEKIWCLQKEWQCIWDSWADMMVWEVSVVTLQETLSVYCQKIRGIKPYCSEENKEPNKAEREITWEINEEVLSHIELCKLLVPLTLNLQNANLRSHHWDRIKSLVKTEFDKDSESFTLGFLQKLNLTSYEREITSIMIDASEETKIVTDIRDIETLVAQITVNLKPIPSMGIAIIQSTSDANTAIVELNMRLQSVSSSFHAKPYIDDINAIQTVLDSMITFLEGVEELQKKWSTLEPFFHVTDVRYHLVNATSLFERLNERWRKLSTTMLSEHYLQPIVVQQHIQDEVISLSKGFNGIPSLIQPYLQDRREQFFRLWLLSDDDLVDAISTVVDGEYAKPFLLKLFTNIAKIKQEKNSQIGGMEIIGVFSKEGEFLELNSYVPMLGNFDSWLNSLSVNVEATLKENVRQCRNSIKSAGIRVDEVLKLWPLQVASLAFMVHWTAEMSRSLAKYKGHLNTEQLQPFKKRIKDTQGRLDGCLQGNLSKFMREKFRLFYMSLLLIRDFLSVTSENRKGFTNESDMMVWHTVDKDTDNLLVHFGSSELMYSWEYQGFWSFTVLTPTVLQTLINLAKVLTKGMSVGVNGVSGSSKTETVKTMAHLLGRHLVTISSTDSLTSMLLVHSILATCCSHSWLFFENAHRLDPAVIPVLGEVIQVVQQTQRATSVAIKTPAKPTKLQQQPIKLLEGVQVTVSPLAAVLLELESKQPASRKIMDSLRETFRPVITFTPSLQVITECLMLADGFKEFKALSQKLTHSLQSLSTSLPQLHRNQLDIKGAAAVVSLAKEVMRRQPEIDEIDTVPVALKEYITPQLRKNDIPIFHEVFELLFPDFDAAPYVNDVLREALVQSMKESDLIVKDCYVEKILQLHDAISRYQKIILFGSPKSGKSTSLRMLENTYNALNEEGNLNFKATNIEVLNPLIVEDEHFYGPHRNIVGKTEEGYLPKMIKKYHKVNLTSENWIVLQGPIKHSWLTNFFLRFHPTNNTFLSGNAQATPLPSNVKIIVEISGDISDLTYIELNQCYTVYFQDRPKLWEDIIQSWLDTISNKKIARALQSLVRKNLPNFINMLKPDSVTKPSMVMKARAFVALLSSLLETDLIDDDPDDWVEKLTPSFIFSIIWSFGASISSSEADEFKEVVTRMTENVPEGGIYDYYVDTSSGNFVSWRKTTGLENRILCNPLLKTNVVFTDRMIKYTKVAQTLMDQGIPILLKGDPGSGKSTILNILRQTSDEARDTIFISYTASTKPKDIQDNLQKNLLKQGKDVLAGKKSKVHFLIDDLQCSKGEIVLQEMLETVRYTENERKVYSHDTRSFLNIPEICFLCAYQTKESQKILEEAQAIDENVETHWSEAFHMLTLPSCQTIELESIFISLFDQNLSHFEQEVKCLKTVIAEGVVHLYERMGEITQEKLGNHLPILHHPRQIISVLKGLQLADEETQDKDNFLKHLAHECYRVFQDSGILKLSEFDGLLNDVLNEYLCVCLDSVCSKSETFLLTRVGNKEELYTDADLESINAALLKRGQAIMGHKQNYALYNSLTHHTIHIARVIGSLDLRSKSLCPKKLPIAMDNIGGHLVLVGPEGCGKKTCARLVASMAGYKIYDIIGTPSEYLEKKEKIEEDLCSGIPVIVVIDWNILENIENISFLNSMLVAELNGGEIDNQNITVRIMLSVSSVKDAHEIFKYIPAAASFYTIDYFQEWNVSELQNIAKQILSDTLKQSLSDIKIQCVAEIMSYIHAHIASEKWNPSARFLELIKLVLLMHDKLFDNIQQEKEKLKISIQKFEETQKRVTELSRQLEEQRAQVTYIQQSCGSVVLKMRNIKSEQGRLQQDLNKNAALLKRQKDEAQRIRELISRDLAAPKLEMKAIHRKLDRITRAELEGLKGLGRPSQGVGLIFDAVLTALGLDPSWNEAKRQMGNGLNFISAIRKIPVEDTEEKVLLRIQSYLSMEELDIDKVTEDSFTAATFLSWLHAFEKYVRVYKDYHPLKVQADIIARDIEATEEVIAKYEDDLAGFGMEYEVLMAQLKEKEQQLEVAEEEMKILEGRIQLAQKVMEQLGEDKIHWEEALSHCSVKHRNIFGDAVLAAAYVTYIGSFLHVKRQGVLKDWQKKMDELCIFHTEDKDVLDVLAPLDLQVRWHEQGLPLDTFSLENAAVIYNSNLPQLVIDPHSIMEYWIHNWENATEIDLNSDYMDDIEKAMEAGSTAVIVQEELYLPTQVLQLLEMERSILDDENKIFLKVGERLLPIHEGFKIVIIIKSQEVNIDNNIKTLVNIVNMQSQQEGLEKLLTFRVASHCQPDLFESLKRSEWDLLERQKILEEQEAMIRDLMSRFDDDVLEESTLMELLQAACAKATDAKKKCHDLRRTLDAAREGNNTYKKISGLLTSLYLLVEQLPCIHPSLVIGIDYFSDMIIGDMTPQSFAISWGKMLSSNTVLKMLQTFFRFIQQQVSDITVVTVGLVLAIWYERHISLTTPQFCSLLYSSLIKESRSNQLELKPVEKSKRDTHILETNNELEWEGSRPTWLTQNQWLQLLELSKIEPFCEIMNHITTYNDLWRVWYVTEQPETGSFPKHLDKRVRGMAKLILMNCLRPDRLDEAAMLYVKRVLKQEVASPTAKALLSVAAKGTATKPIIIYSSAPLDVEHILRQIQPLCHPVLTSNPESVNVLAVGEGREETLRLLLKRCAQKGYWVVLKKDERDQSSTDYVSRLLREKFLEDANKRFQVWIYMQNEDYLPKTLMASCYKVYLSLPSTMKESLIHLYELIGESRLAPYINEWSKWCLLSLALFHIAYITRQSLEDSSTLIAQTLGDTQWEEAENVLRTLVLEAPSLDSTILPLLLPQLTDIYITGALTEDGSHVLSQLLQYYLSQEVIQNVPGRVSALTHYTVPRTNSMEDHLAQMEFIYLAQNVSLTCVAPTLIFESQRDEAKSINIAMYNISDDSNHVQPLCREDWVKYFSLNKAKKLESKKLQGSLGSILKHELNNYLNTVQTLVSKLKVSAGPDSLLKILEGNVPGPENELNEVDEVSDAGKKMQKLAIKGQYLCNLINSNAQVRSIRLGLLLEPSSAWSALVRSIWGEVRGDGIEVAVVTKEVWSGSGQKGEELRTKTAGDEDDGPTLLLEEMALCGASWDAKEEQITTEELAAATPFISLLNLSVSQFDGRAKKLMKKPGRSYRAPVYVNGNTASPLFWMHLPLSPAITAPTCLLRGVCLVAS